MYLLQIKKRYLSQTYKKGVDNKRKTGCGRKTCPFQKYVHWLKQFDLKLKILVGITIMYKFLIDIQFRKSEEIFRHRSSVCPSYLLGNNDTEINTLTAMCVTVHTTRIIIYSSIFFPDCPLPPNNHFIFPSQFLSPYLSFSAPWFPRKYPSFPPTFHSPGYESILFSLLLHAGFVICAKWNLAMDMPIRLI